MAAEFKTALQQRLERLAHPSSASAPQKFEAASRFIAI
jgi:hypothetical protein